MFWPPASILLVEPFFCYVWMSVAQRNDVLATNAGERFLHIFDFDEDIYGEEISVALHVFLRAEQKFAALDALKAQIAQDAQAARKLLDAGR